MIRLTTTAQSELRRYSATLEPGCFVGLLKARREGSDADQWYLGAYAPDQIAALTATYNDAAIPLVHEVTGIRVLIPQAQLVQELEAGVLDFGRKGYCVIPG
jgi:hypothetical protein